MCLALVIKLTSVFDYHLVSLIIINKQVILFGPNWKPTFLLACGEKFHVWSSTVLKSLGSHWVLAPTKKVILCPCLHFFSGTKNKVHNLHYGLWIQLVRVNWNRKKEKNFVCPLVDDKYYVLPTSLSLIASLVVN